MQLIATIIMQYETKFVNQIFIIFYEYIIRSFFVSEKFPYFKLLKNKPFFEYSQFIQTLIH